MSIPDELPIENPRDRRPLPARVLALGLLVFMFPAPLAAAAAEAGNVEFKPFDPAQTRRLVPISAEAAAAHPGLLPLKPASGIIDDHNVLTVKQRTAIARELIIAAVEADTHVYIVTLKKAPAASAEQFAGELLDSWRTSPVSGLVLYFAGASDDWRNRIFVVPGIVAGAPDLSAALATAATAARTKALEASEPGAAIESACRGLLAELRDLPMALRTLELKVPPARQPAADPLAPAPAAPSPVPDLEARKRNVLLAFAAAAVVAIAIFLVRHYLRNRPVRLPDSEFRYRLCAPYSGGNCARLDFKDRRQHALASSER